MGLFTPQPPLVFVFIFVAYGFSTLLLAFNFAHDFAHGTIFKNNQWNHLAFVALYTLMGAHGQSWKIRHVHAHHFAPNVQAYDPDLQMTDLIRVIPGTPLKWFHRYQYIYAPIAYTIYSLYWIFIKDVVLFFSNKDPLLTPYKTLSYRVSFWVQKAFYIGYLLLLPLRYSPQNGYIIVLGFILMHLFMSLFLLFTFFMTHHVEGTFYPSVDSQGHIQSSWVMNQIKSSNDMHPFSVTANFILGGFNNHIVHHLFPNVHHIHYPKMSVALYKTLRKNGIEPNQTSYWNGIVSHLSLLKRMGKPA